MSEDDEDEYGSKDIVVLLPNSGFFPPLAALRFPSRLLLIVGRGRSVALFVRVCGLAPVFISVLRGGRAAAEGRFASPVVVGVSVSCEKAEVKLSVVVAEGLRDEGPEAALGFAG